MINQIGQIMLYVNNQDESVTILDRNSRIPHRCRRK